jgi:hypothetical protein
MQVPDDLPADTFTQHLKAGADLDSPDIWSRQVAPIIVARFALLRDEVPPNKVRSQLELGTQSVCCCEQCLLFYVCISVKAWLVMLTLSRACAAKAHGAAHCLMSWLNRSLHRLRTPVCVHCTAGLGY